MTALLATGPVVGVAVVELAVRGLARVRLGSRLETMQTQLRAFRAASTDEDRQRLILRSAGTTFTLSALMLALAASLFALTATTPWVLHADRDAALTFYGVVSVTSMAWALGRPLLLRSSSTTARVRRQLQ